jgi:phosphatidate cytidylyltransferase
MNKELKKRVITSICLFSLLTIMFFYTFILIISLIIIGIIAWIEFYALISKILLNDNIKDKVLKFLYKSISLIYLSLIVWMIIITKSKNNELEIVVIYSIMISIMSDIGGLVIGKLFKGKKLTRISPKKTISGSVGSFTFSLILIPFFYKYFADYEALSFIVITLAISLTSQLGDLFISYLKRKAQVKDTSDLLPGHGGILDRIDGIIFAIPIGFLILNI